MLLLFSGLFFQGISPLCSRQKAVTVFYLYSRVEKIRVFFLELHESAVLKALAYLLHEGIIEPEIVHDAQAHGEHLAGLEQVSDICSRMSAAGRAGALGIDRAQVALILCVVEIDYTAHGEKMSVAGIAAGHDAIEKVDTARNTSRIFPGVPTPIR